MQGVVRQGPDELETEPEARSITTGWAATQTR